MQNKSRVFAVQDDFGRRAGLAGKWVTTNKLAVYGYNHVKRKDQLSPYAPGNAIVNIVRPYNIIFEPQLRKLVNQSFMIYTQVYTLIYKTKFFVDGAESSKIDKQLDKIQTLELRNGLLTASKQYRAVIRECLENLNDVLTKIDRTHLNEDEKDQEKNLITNYITILYSIECIWYLCEILYIDNLPSDILKKLLSWIRFHYPSYEKVAVNVLNDNILISGAEQHDNYWATVIGVMMHGRIDYARLLLKKHSATDSLPFQKADEVLKNMPIYDVYDGSSMNNFLLKWKHWKTETQTKLDSMTFATQKELNILIKLAIGDPIAWKLEGMKLCQSWYEYMVSKLYFTDQTIRVGKLGDFARTCLKEWTQARAYSNLMNKDNCNVTQLKHLDHTILVLMQLDIVEVLKEMQDVCDGGWFACHITNLLYHCDAIDLENNESEEPAAEKLHESLILEYGTLLMSHNSLWQIGAGYLASCKSATGIFKLKELLEHIPLKNENRTTKILNIAKQYGLNDTIISICKQRSIMSLRQGELLSSLVWALKSNDPFLCGILADQILKKYFLNKKFSNQLDKNITDEFLETIISTLTSLGAEIVINDRLLFLSKYCEYIKTLKYENNLKEACKLLVTLITSKLIPKYLMPTVLIEIIPLTKLDEKVLCSDDIHEILYFLEKYLEEQNANEETTDYYLDDDFFNNSRNKNLKSIEKSKEKQLNDACIQSLRISLAKHFSNSLVREIQNVE